MKKEHKEMNIPKIINKIEEVSTEYQVICYQLENYELSLTDDEKSERLQYLRETNYKYRIALIEAICYFSSLLKELEEETKGA